MLGRSEAEFWGTTPAKVELLAALRDRYQPSTQDTEPAPARQDDAMDLFSLAGMQIG